MEREADVRLLSLDLEYGLWQGGSLKWMNEVYDEYTGWEFA